MFIVLSEDVLDKVLKVAAVCMRRPAWTVVELSCWGCGLYSGLCSKPKLQSTIRFILYLSICENAPLLVTHILENVHNRNYKVRATCSNSVSDGLCVAHTTFHSLHRDTLTVFTFSRRERKVSQGASVTHKHTHTGTQSRAVCMLLASELLVFTALLCHPE